MKEYPPAFKHGEIIEVLPDIFVVTGQSIFHHGDKVIQKSNNMTIVRSGQELTLINTLRLNENGLKALEALGKVTHVIRLGAFHDRNDLFYLDRYRAKLWALKGMAHKNNRQADFIIGETKDFPFPKASFFRFETTREPEAILYIDSLDGVLVTCDSIKNWTEVDEYFGEQTATEFLKLGLIAPASIDKVWLGAMMPQKSDFLRLLQLRFKHLLSAHGRPLLMTAKEELKSSIERSFQ